MNRAGALLFTSVLGACVGCDHASKYAATVLMDPVQTVSLASGALRFELAYNEGAFLGLGADLPATLRLVLLGAVVPLGLFVVIAWLLRATTSTTSQLAALGLIVGGGLGNWIDRVFHDGRVTDFVSLGLGPLRTGVFNFADVAVMAGMLWLLVASRSATDAERELG
jgi:signal peptidase II